MAPLWNISKTSESWLHVFPVFLQFCRVVCKLHEVKTLSSSLLYPYHLEQHITHRRPSINNGWIDEWTVALPWYAQYGFSLLHLPYLAPLTTGPEQSVLLILLGRNDCGLGTITCPELRLVKASRKKRTHLDLRHLLTALQERVDVLHWRSEAPWFVFFQRRGCFNSLSILCVTQESFSLIHFGPISRLLLLANQII